MTIETKVMVILLDEFRKANREQTDMLDVQLCKFEGEGWNQCRSVVMRLPEYLSTGTYFRQVVTLQREVS